MEATALAEQHGDADTAFDEEGGEGDATAMHRDHLLQLARTEDDAADEAERAITRLDVGRYGICARCGHAIGVQRLEALPTTTVCVACKAGRLR